MAEDIFAETNAVEGAPATAAPAPAPVAVEPSSPAAPETAAQVAAPQTTPRVESQDPTAPLKALLDERDRRQAAEREAAELKAWRADQERKQQAAAAKAPNPLDDPEGFSHWVQSVVTGTREQVSQEFEDRLWQRTSALSRAAMERHLGDKFAELAEFIDKAPDGAHQAAMQQDDPYGWFYANFQRSQKAKRAEELAAKVGDKDFDAFIEEQIAARLAAQTQTAPAEAQAPARPEPNRAPDGKFAPAVSEPPQRHRAPSLATVNGAVASARTVNDSAYFEDEFSKR